LYFHDLAKLPPGISPHSTAMCSILLGEDAYAFSPQLGRFHYQGVAPAAEANIYEFWHFLKSNVYGALPPEVDIVTASIGSQFEDWWTRGIESMAEQYGLIVVAGIGNGFDAHDSLLYPGAGANVIGVGVVNSVNSEDPAIRLANFSLARPEHSSCGPTADNRCKPDIVAPGNCLAADSTEPNRYEPTGDWSSFATPIVSGTIGLLVQKARQDPNLAAAVSDKAANCIMKAIVLNSATKLPYWRKGRPDEQDDHEAPLDYIQGAGMINAVRAYEHLVAGPHKPGSVPNTGWDANLAQKDKNPKSIYKINLEKPADKLITATLAWNRHYSGDYPFEPQPQEDSDFRLELWAVDPERPANSHLLDYSDSETDNVEHIYCRADPNYDNYEIVISFSDAAKANWDSEMQRYALAWSVTEADTGDNIYRYDLNDDGIVNELDFITLTSNWVTSVTSPGYYFIGDIDTNGVFDVNDLQILINHNNRKADWYKEISPAN
jgi:hypothetical protein